MNKLWSDEAKAYMREHASELDLDELMDGLRQIEGFARTRLAVLGMRYKMGLSTRQSKHWTDEDRRILKTAYRYGVPDEVIGRTLERTATAIKNQRKKLRLIAGREMKQTTTPGRYVTNWQDISEQWRQVFLDKVCADLARDGIKHEVQRREKGDRVLYAVWREASVDTVPERSEKWRHTYGK